MNSLSWMIYLAGITGSLKEVLWLSVIVSLFAAGFATAQKWHEDYVGIETGRVARVAFGSAARIALALGLAASIIPSSKTIYAIAASEMGETALNSETGGKAVKALNAWLDRQIEGKEETE